MTSPEAAATRTLALELPEHEWEALRAIEPDAVGWLRALIHSRVSEPRPSELQTAEFDDY